jgi:hypothetical protein
LFSNEIKFGGSDVPPDHLLGQGLYEGADLGGISSCIDLHGIDGKMVRKFQQ